MKKRSLFCLMFAFIATVVLTFTASAAEAKAEGSWTFAEYTYGETQGVEVLGYSGTQSDIYIPATLDGKPVLKVGDSAFKGMIGLNSVTFSDGIRVLGNNAFESVESLVCVLLNEGLETIGNDVFDGCTNFNSIILYDSIVSIGDTIFTGCSELTVYCSENSFAHMYTQNNSVDIILLGGTDNAPEIVVINGIEYYIYSLRGEAVLTGADSTVTEIISEVTVPTTITSSSGKIYPVTEIRASAFSGCSVIERIILPSSIKTIGEYAFANSASIQHVTLPEGLTYITNHMFYNNTAINNIIIPSSAGTIYHNAFNGCSNLKNVFIPEGVLYIGGSAFQNSGLTSVSIPYSCLTVESYAFAYCGSLNTIEILNCETALIGSTFRESGCSHIKVPHGLKNIDDIYSIFFNCGSAGRYIYIESIASWCENHFKVITSGRASQNQNYWDLYVNNNKATTVTIPEEITKIDEYTFSKSNISKVILHDKVESVGTYAFGGCRYLNTVQLSANTECSSAFSSFNGGTVYVDNLNKLIDNGKCGYLISRASKVYDNNVLVDEYTVPAHLTAVPSYIGNSSDSMQNTWLKKVILHDKITSIPDNAFRGCVNLTDITIPQGNTAVILGKDAFKGCSKLTNVYLTNYNKWTQNTFSNSYSSPLYYASNLYVNGEKFTTLEIPEDVTVITSGMAGKWVAKVVLHKNVTEIASGAFSGSSQIKEIIIPEGITKIGDAAFSGCSGITTITIPGSVVEIGAAAFENCTGLTSIIIPDSVKQIGGSLFYGCTNLTGVTLSKGLTTLPSGSFRECTSLTEIEIPGNIQTISDYVFYNCSNLSTVILNDGLLNINSRAFGACTSLADLKIPNTVTALNGSVFYDCTGLKTIELSQNITSLGVQVFYNCTSLSEIVIPEGVTSINMDAFYFCESLKSITLPESLNNIYDNFVFFMVPDDAVWTVYDSSWAHNWVFARGKKNINVLPTIAKYLTFEISNGNALVSSCLNTVVGEIIIPDVYEGYPVTEIKSEAFMGCNTITKVVIPESVTTIGNSAFKNCNDLAEITIPEGVTSIPSSAFEKSGLVSIAFPTSVTSIGEGAFRGCFALKNVTIPGTVKNIGNEAFKECKILGTLTVENGVEKIGAFAFEKCLITRASLADSITYMGQGTFYTCYGSMDINIPTGLSELPSAFAAGSEYMTSVSIPANITRIGNNAFDSCTKLSGVIFNEGLKTIGSNSFLGCTSLKNITIPQTVESILNDAFKNCHKLESINIPENVTSINDGVFLECNALKTCGFHDGITSVGAFAFKNCYVLEDIFVNENITSVGNYAFENCDLLREVSLSKNITKIGDGAFIYCNGLEKVLFPYEITSGISATAFSNAPKAILWVFEDSYGLDYGKSNNYLCFIRRKTLNPEIDYGTAISGKVSYTNGTAASGVTVQLIYDDGVVGDSTTTDANGQFSFPFAEVGTYTLIATDGTDIDTEAVAIKRKNVFSVIQTGRTNLTLRKGWTVSGTANATAGVSEENPITVTMTDIAGNIIATANITAPNGAFSFDNINNDEYIIVAENNNGTDYENITVYNANCSNISLVIDDYIPDIPVDPDDPDDPKGFASIVGKVYIEDRIDENFPDRTPDRHSREWVKLSIYDGDGNLIKHTKSVTNFIDEQYDYIFKGLPMGEYTIVAQVTVMRPHHHHLHKNDPRFKDRKCEYMQPFPLKGYAYVEVTEAKQYVADDIILAEENDTAITIKGKVTAAGSSQPSTVILRDVFHNEIATYKTAKNGKFEFRNVKDGLYFLTAITDYDGAGFAVVSVRNGKIGTKFFDKDSKLNNGEIHIKIGKHDKVREYEEWFKDKGRFHGCNKDNVHEFKTDLEELKRFYDGLSDRDRQGFAPAYLERFWEMIEWLNCEQQIIDSDDSFSDDEKEKFDVDNIGSIIPSEDIKDGKSYSVTLSVNRLSEEELKKYDLSQTEDSDDYIEIESDEQYHQAGLEENAKNNGKQLGKNKKDKDGNETDEVEYFYYNIELSYKGSDGNEIKVSDIAKDTDTNGKIRLRLPIPAEFLDEKYNSYSLIHIHNGEITNLVDLDEDPLTITVEVDKFSVFAFARGYEEIATSFTIIWQNDDGTVLETDENVAAGAVPEYNGEKPVKEADSEYTYEFTGWTPEVSEATIDITYTAVYESIPVSVDTHKVEFTFGGNTVTEAVIPGKTITLPAVTDEIKAAFIPENSGEPISAYTFYWKAVTNDASLAEYTEAEGYYLPGTEYTPTEDTGFEAAWVYTDAQLVLVSNPEKADEAYHEFVYDIYLESVNESSITKIESGQFDLGITTADNKRYGYEFTPNTGITIHYEEGKPVLFKRVTGDTPYLVPMEVDGAYRILLGSIKITGTGEGTVSLTNASACRHIITGSDADNKSLDVYVRSAVENYTLNIPTASLKVTVEFKNSVEDNTHEYQNMTLTLSGGDLTHEITVKLGNDSPELTVDEPYKNGEKVTAGAMSDGKYTVTFDGILSLNRSYNVILKGDGYRTARYTVSMSADKELYFWNNVMDSGTFIEKDTLSSHRITTFLAGDIVKDNDINIYDLSAVVSYFGAKGISVSDHPNYIKYDLNRDGKIDSRDVAYVLVSWGK